MMSHIKEKIVYVDNQSQAESKRLADIDENIAKVFTGYQLVFILRRGFARYQNGGCQTITTLSRGGVELS